MAQGKKPAKTTDSAGSSEIERLRYELGVWKRLLAVILVAKGQDYGDGIHGVHVAEAAKDAIPAEGELHDIPGSANGREVRYVFFSLKSGARRRCTELAKAGDHASRAG